VTANTNKYLEKIARNKFEQHLANKSPNATFDNKKVQRAHGIVQESKMRAMNSRSLGALGAKKEVVDNYLKISRQLMQKQRGNILQTSKVTVESPFRNTGDSLQKKRNNPVNRVAKFEEKKNPFFKRAIKNLKKNPLKAGLVGAGVLGGAAAIGYGVKSLTRK
jgi:hypothetical protein